MPTPRTPLRPPPGQTSLAARLAAPDQADQVEGTSYRRRLFSASRRLKSLRKSTMHRTAMIATTIAITSSQMSPAFAASSICSIEDFSSFKAKLWLTLGLIAAVHVALSVLALQIDRIIWAWLERRS